MKKIFWLLVCSLFCFILTGARTLQADNMLQDPSFEAGSPHALIMPPPWYKIQGGAANAQYEALDAHSGTYVAWAYTSEDLDRFVRLYQDFPVTLPQGFYASAYIQTPDPSPPWTNWIEGSQAWVSISFRNASGQIGDEYKSEIFTQENTNWVQYTVGSQANPITAPTEATTVRFSVYLEKPQGVTGAQSVINFDDCFMESVTPPPAMNISHTNLDFGAYKEDLSFYISNSGSGTLHWDVQTDGQNWVTVAPPSSGDVVFGEQDKVTILVDRSELTPGEEYSARLTATPDVGDPQYIAVYATVPAGVPNQCSWVRVEGSQLKVNRRLPGGNLDAARPYEIKGFCWSPAQEFTPGNADLRRVEFTIWDSLDLGMIKGCNANTVRTYIYLKPDDPDYKEVLDICYENGIMVIMSVHDNGAWIVNWQEYITNIVNGYKDHPAILMWSVGNEWNIAQNGLYCGHFTNLQDAADWIEDVAAFIKSLDSNHPVASIYGEINIPATPDTNTVVNNICTSVDVWGLNIYRGNEFYELFNEWAAITSKPMFIAEFGTDAYFTADPDNPGGPDDYISEQIQADWDHSLWVDIYPEMSANNPSKLCLGGTAFEWNDEWWKVTSPGLQDPGGFYTYWNPGAHPDSFANEEYFGIVGIVQDEDMRDPRLAYYQFLEDFAYLLNLDVAYHQEEQENYSGAACAQMTLDYIHGGSSGYSQTDLYNFGIAHNEVGSLLNFDPIGMRATLDNYEPGNYSYGIRSFNDPERILKEISTWMAYNVPGASVPNSPAQFPAYGLLSNWMTVKGMRTSQNPNHSGYFTVHGFWIHDPDNLPSGIGQNSYKAAWELNTQYVLPLVPYGSPSYDNKCIAVVEPPEESNTDVRIAAAKFNFTGNDNSNNKIIKAAEKALKEELVPFDPEVKEILTTAKAAEPFLVNNKTGSYYLVPFNILRSGLTGIVVILDAKDGKFMEASWSSQGAKYLPISKEVAIKLALKEFSKNIATPKYKIKPEINAGLARIDNNLYHPSWRVKVGGSIYIVKQDGTIYSEDDINIIK